MSRLAAAALAAALVGGLAVGCGAEEQPPPAPSAAEQVATLATSLEKVDGAIVGGRWAEARTLLDQLTRDTIAARDEGQLDDDAADRILGAIARLRALLPAPPPPPTPTPTPTPKPAPPASEPTLSEKELKKLQEELKRLEEQRRRLEEERRKERDDRGKDDEKDD